MVNTANKMKVSVNRDKNRLYCSWDGNVSKSDIDRFFTDIRYAVLDLQPGFAVINDLSHCNYSELSGIPVFQRVMQYLVNQGMKDIVRVIKSNSLIYCQVSNLSLRNQGYIPVYTTSLEDADQFLDEQAQRTHIRLKMLEKEVHFKVKDAWQIGQLQDLSLGGCAIIADTELPEPGQQVEIFFSLTDNKKQENKFGSVATVTRFFSTGFAVAFVTPNGMSQKKLTECLGQTLIEACPHKV